MGCRRVAVTGAGPAGVSEEPEVAPAEVCLVRRPAAGLLVGGSSGSGVQQGPRIVVGSRHAGSAAVADEVEELVRRVEVGGAGVGLRVQAVAADRQHVAVGRLEGELREPGGGEVGPDGRRGVGRATVPGPDDLRPRPAEPRQRLDGARDVSPG